MHLGSCFSPLTAVLQYVQLIASLAKISMNVILNIVVLMTLNKLAVSSAWQQFSEVISFPSSTSQIMKESRAARLSDALIWLYRPPAPPRFFAISALRIPINFRFEVLYGILCAEKNCENRELIALHRTFL